MTDEEIKAQRDATCRTHCCVLHGCKYCDPDCPVVNRRLKQAYSCEDCEYDCDGEIPNPDSPDYDLLKMSEKELREECRRLRAVLRKQGHHQ